MSKGGGQFVLIGINTAQAMKTVDVARNKHAGDSHWYIVSR